MFRLHNSVDISSAINNNFYLYYLCRCNIAVVDGAQTLGICFEEFQVLLNRLLTLPL